MAKVYDPILCMMVDKPATRTTDAKGGKYEIYGDVVTLKSVTPTTVKYETSNGFIQTIGRKKWDELAKKANDAMDSKTIDKAIKACNSNDSAIDDFNEWKQLCNKAVDAGKKAQKIFDKTGSETKEFKAAEKEWKTANKAQANFALSVGSKYNKGDTDDLWKFIKKYERATMSSPYYQALRPDGITTYSSMAILKNTK